MNISMVYILTFGTIDPVVVPCSTKESALEEARKIACGFVPNENKEGRVYCERGQTMYGRRQIREELRAARTLEKLTEILRNEVVSQEDEIVGDSEVPTFVFSLSRKRVR